MTEIAVRIAVGVITRRRPEGLRRLLESFAQMDRPAGADIQFVICENDSEARAGGVVEAFRAKIGLPVHLLLETRKGIPFARSCVLAEALEKSFDFLTFIDDDEVVERDWLVRMMEAVETRGLDLAAGPVRFIAPDEPLTEVNRAILQQLQARFSKDERAQAAKVAAGDDGDTEAYTGNWCLRLDTARRLGVTKFDEWTAESGGEDSAFCAAMQAGGARIGWVPDAIAHEIQPVRRLTLSYVYRRNRDQERTKVRLRPRSLRNRASYVAKRSAELVLIGIAAPVLLVLRPKDRGELLFKVARKAGKTAGMFGSMFGMKSRHYASSQDLLHIERGA
ncbi:glycosyltransferase [Oceanicola sp. D3]|uniref:glycosyltransferase n=1 Tax=Oceanicola sp. D3 TaxID=2587163 RepID=UPI0011223629|nr:glycosyltransferase family 2 protein [Oceanicola sp. D3]QDC10171.1 glycosyltransferase [Oceanicola sp. D3]